MIMYIAIFAGVLGTITMSSDTKKESGYTSDKVKYAVQIEGATEEMCVQIVTTNWGTPGSSGFMGLSVGTDVKAVNTGTASDTVALIGNKDHPAPMGIGAAASACSEDGLTINLSFR